MAGIPFRMGGNAEWLHDFYVATRRIGVCREGATSAPWTLSGARGQADVIKAGLSVDVGLSKASTMRVYGEYEFFRSGHTTRFGVSYTIGFEFAVGVFEMDGVLELSKVEGGASLLKTSMTGISSVFLAVGAGGLGGEEIAPRSLTVLSSNGILRSGVLAVDSKPTHYRCFFCARFYSFCS